MHFANKHLPFSLLSSTFLFCFHCSFFSGISALLRGLPNSKATCRCHRRRTAKIFFWQKQKYFLRDLLQYVYKVKVWAKLRLCRKVFFLNFCVNVCREFVGFSHLLCPLSVSLCACWSSHPALGQASLHTKVLCYPVIKLLNGIITFVLLEIKTQLN